MRLRTCDVPVAVARRRYGTEVRVMGWRSVMLALALALGAILTFAVGKVAECSIAGDAGSYRPASVAVPAHSHSVADPEVADPEVADPELLTLTGSGSDVQQCHHGSDHQHKGSASKMYSSSTRGVGIVSATMDFGRLDWSAAGAVSLAGLRWRGPPSDVSRLSASGREILISGCVART